MSAPSNVIFDRLTRDPWFPNLRLTIVLGIVLAPPTSIAVWFDMSCVSGIEWIIPVLGPLLAAGTAALTAARDSQTEAYTLLKVTSIPRSTITWGYFWASLYRARALLVIVIGVFLPAIVVNQIRPDLPYQQFSTCLILMPPGETFPSDSFAGCTPNDDPRLIATKAFISLTSASTILLAIPLAMLGVALGLAGRQKAIAAAAAVVLMGGVALILMLALLGPVISGVGFYCINQCYEIRTWPIDFTPPLIYLAALPLATLFLERLARRYV